MGKMAQNQKENVNVFGEIGTIRDIIMGQYVADTSNRFEYLETELIRIETSFNDRIAELEGRTNARFSALEQKMEDRFDRLEDLLRENVTQLHEKIEAVSTDDKANLGQMLSEIGKALMK